MKPRPFNSPIRQAFAALKALPGVREGPPVTFVKRWAEKVAPGPKARKKPPA